MSFIEKELSLCFLGRRKVSQLENSIGRVLFRSAAPLPGCLGFSPLDAKQHRQMPPASRHRAHLHWEAWGPGMGKREALIILAGSVRGTLNFFFFFFCLLERVLCLCQ